ncbi:MAG TPA: hypothetical protein VN625_11705 [Desulfuromonadaceae bacterium]|nr:hypothetical protein [Desulfuromonadaceae bacterium]
MDRLNPEPSVEKIVVSFESLFARTLNRPGERPEEQTRQFQVGWKSRPDGYGFPPESRRCFFLRRN